MAYILVIVESPAKTASFEKALGHGYRCIASFGHIRELSKLENIDRENDYKPTFKNSTSKLKQIAKLKEAVSKASGVFLATDDDKEGEAIAWHLCQVLKLPVAKTPRMIFHEVTPTAIQAAIRAPTVINMNKVLAAQARQILDLLVGFQISPLLWNKFGGQLGLSAGRCQTPALRLVYENQKDIDKNPGKIAYTTTGYFTQKAIQFTLNYQHETAESMSQFLEDTVTTEFEHKMSIEKETNGSKSAPKPFTTSSMQQAANTELRISPKEAMMICQKLYENGLITYMRTDSRTYSKDFVASAKGYITEKYGANNVRDDIDSLTLRSSDCNADSNKKSKSKSKTDTKNKTKDSASSSSAQEAHEAIRPTKVSLKGLSNEQYSPKERKMYYMIWRNTVESCMKPCLTKSITANITAPDGYAYRSTQEQIIDPGWKLVDGYEKENANYKYFAGSKALNASAKSNSAVVNYSKITSRLGIKDSKGHYTEAKLVQLLEEKGIGRPSTFSSLIDKIQERGYVKRGDVEGKAYNGVEYELVGEELTETNIEKQFGGERNKLILQPLGAMVWEYLRDKCKDLFEYEYTKKMEADLDMIESGEKQLSELCRSCDVQIAEIVEENKKSRLSNSRSTTDETVSDNDDTNTNSKTKTKAKAKAKANGADIKIDDKYTFTIARYGPVVYSVINGKKVYKTAKANLDIEDIRSGKLKVEDIIDYSKNVENSLGMFEDKPVVLKNGKFGYYLQWGEKNISIKSMLSNAGAQPRHYSKFAPRKSKKELENDLQEEVARITLDAVRPLLIANSDLSYENEEEGQTSNTISNANTVISQDTRFRQINANMSVRIGKSPYVYYKTKKMSKPKFLHLKKFDEDPFTCDENVLLAWLEIIHKMKFD